MDRLIKLLNNYLIEKDKSIYTFYWDNVFNCINRLNGERSDNEWICSKSFGFIKRLAYNNKIDRDKVLRIGYEIEDGVFYHYDDYYSLLMILAVQDKPINFLISILK